MIELPTHDGDKLYAWIQHTKLVKVRDRDDWFDFIDEFGDVIMRDTGLNEFTLRALASHITITRIYDSIEAYTTGQDPVGSGVSICSVKDHFSRKNGRIRAIKRALGNMRLLLSRDGVVHPQHLPRSQVVASEGTQEEETIYELV